MDFSSIFFIAISFICLLLLTNSLLSSKNSKKKCPPSPPSLPIIGHLHLLKKPLHQTLSHISNRYGPILLLRFGFRRVLIVSSLSLAEECFIKNDIIFANRPQFPSIKYLSYDYTTMGSTNYGPHWRNLRRIATVEILSSNRLNSFEHIRAEEVRSMLRRLFKESSSREKTKVELKSRLFELTLNNMMRMIVGKRYCSENSEDSEEAQRFWKCVEEVLELSGASNLGDFLPLLRWTDVQGVEKKMKRLAKFRDGFLQSMVDDRRKKGQMGESCMVGDLLEMQDKDPEYYTDEIIKGLIIALLVAGTDTTSQTVEWVISLLLNHPDKLKRAQHEIHNHCHNRLLQESDLSDLPYLQCIIWETLRLYPAGPLLFPHEAAEACTVGGYSIAAGTMLLVNAYAINRDSRTWENPEKFEPERHLDGGGGRTVLSFGMGRRRCPGEPMAHKLVGLVLGTMLQCFDWERVGDELVDMSEGKSITLPRAVPLYAMYQPREGMTGILRDL